MKKVNLFNINFNIVTMDQIIAYLAKVVAEDLSIFIQTVNVDHIILTRKDNFFKKIVDSADIVTCDGMPIVWTSKIKKTPLPERVTGADLTIELCKYSSQYNFKIFILGGEPGVAERAERVAKKLYGNDVKIVGFYSPHYEELINEDSNKIICSIINKSEANVLLMALGTPKQEKWYWNYKKYLKPNVIIGVGAAIDFLAGNKKRAPYWIRNFGFEWLYRLVKEPKRMYKRYLIRDIKFIPLLFKEILK